MITNHLRRRGIGRTHRRTDRRGATLVLIAIMSTAMIGLGALVLNWSYIELTNTQLRSASDAAVKAAVVTLSQTQNQSQARQAAKTIAREYTIGGQELRLRNSDIQFGNSEIQADGSYLFVTGQQPINSARVTASLGNGALAASVPVLFSSLLTTDSFDLQKQSTAGRYDHDICVVVDRSASMAWDLSGVDFSYPEEYNNDSTVQNYFKAPHPNGSRWAKLVEALGVFQEVVDRRNLNAQIGLASYASDYTFGLFESSQVSTDQVMSGDTYDFVNAAAAIGQEPIIGDTNIRRGINEGKNVLLDDEKRGTANRTMILLSDGRRTEGGNPVTKAADLYNNRRIAIHTISFGEGADQATMQAIADAAGGNYYHALTGTDLEAAFEDIAQQLPAVLTY